MKKTLKLTFPHLAAHEKVGDYQKSKAVSTSTRLPSVRWDTASADPDIHLTEVRRIYTETLEALDARREVYKKRRVVLDQQWSELRELETNLRTNFAILDKFVRSNEDKRNRAVANKEVDSKVIERRQKAVDGLKKEIVKLEGVKEEMDKQVSAHGIYSDYLNHVISESSEFRSATEVVDRYESLCQTKTELGRMQSSTFLQLENTKENIGRLAEENTFRLVGMNTLLAQMNSRYKAALANAMHWEKIVYEIKTDALQRFNEITEVKLSIRNLSQMMCKRKGDSVKIPEEDVWKQMNYIKKTLYEMAKMRDQAEILTKPSFSSTKGEISYSS